MGWDGLIVSLRVSRRQLFQLGNLGPDSLLVRLCLSETALLLCQRVMQTPDRFSSKRMKTTTVPVPGYLEQTHVVVCRGLAYIHDFECELSPIQRELFSARQTETEFFHTCVEALVHRKGGHIEMHACLNLASNLAANLDTSAAAQCMEY